MAVSPTYWGERSKKAEEGRSLEKNRPYKGDITPQGFKLRFKLLQKITQAEKEPWRRRTLRGKTKGTHRNATTPSSTGVLN